MGSVARPRPDMAPEVATALGLDPTRPLTRPELSNILGGLRAVVWTEMLQLVVLLSGGIALTIATIHFFICCAPATIVCRSEPTTARLRQD